LCKHPVGYSPYCAANLKYYVRNPCTYESLPVEFTNQNVNSNQSVIDCMIYSKNVTVTNNAKLILDAVIETTIDGDFEVQLGSELEIK
jgi:hypothetical protein